MNKEQYERATQLFAELCQLPSGDREQWLESQNVDDEVVLDLVRNLEQKDRELGGSLHSDPETAKEHRSDLPQPTTVKVNMFDGRPDVPETDAVQPLADYIDLAEIGRGGAGIIYRAHQKSLNRTVAIKMIRRHAELSTSNRFRFQLEAEAAARLNHPNIVPIYEIGGDADCQFFTMKLIEGVDLARWLRSEHPLRDKVDIVRKTAEAIQFAHQNGVLHRDIKPANILIDSANEPHVTDFGLAKYLSSEIDLTMTGQIMGTPSYMAPEQATGSAQATIATDVYGLGAVLYTCLAGKAPLVGENMFETLKMVAELDPEPPSRLRSHVSSGEKAVAKARIDRDLDTICMKCLDKVPAKRYQSADELAQELGRWLRDEPIHARPVSVAERTIKWVRRNRGVAVMGVSMVAVVLFAALAIGWLASNYLDSLRERRIANLVQEIREADVGQLEPLTQEIASDWEAAQAKLSDYFAKAADGTPEKLNLALTLSTNDSTPLDYVIEQLAELSAPEFQTALAFLQPHVNLIAGPLIETFQNASSKDADSSLQAASAAALVMLRLDQVVWPSLSMSNDPTSRNALIDGLTRWPVAPMLLAERLRQERNPAIRQAIVQVLTGIEISSLPSADRDQLVDAISVLYQMDPDPGVHSSAWLALRKWQVVVPEPAVEPTDEDPELKVLVDNISKMRERIATVSIEPPPDHQPWLANLAQQNTQPPDDYVVRYAFDNAEDRYLDDISGTGGRTLGPGETLWVDGVLGSAARVGDENTIEGETSYYPDVNNPFSMGAWIYREVNVPTDEYGTIFSRSVPGDAGFDLWIDEGALGTHLVSIGRGRGGGMIKVAATNKLPVNRWVHVFATYDGSRKAEGVQLFVNGRRVETKVFEPAIWGTIESDAKFCIGQRYDGGQGTSGDRFPFHGNIDEVQMFDRRLTDYEISEHFSHAIHQICKLDQSQRTAVQREILQQHHQELLAADLRAELADLLEKLQERREQKKRHWYISRGGPSFAILSRPGTSERLPYTLAVATCPITVEQYQRFNKMHNIDSTMSPSVMCPVNSASRHDAAAYCNWLSEQDGIPPEEWCYEEVEYAAIHDVNNLAAGDGHAVFYKEKDNSTELAGYRLPTLDEWHFACQAGADTKYFFGSEADLFSRYGWSSENAGGHSQPVGTLLPNHYGIFDMHGGLWEWTSQGARHDCRIVGGSIQESADRLTFEISHSRDQFSRESNKTFRVVRTVK